MTPISTQAPRPLPSSASLAGALQQAISGAAATGQGSSVTIQLIPATPVDISQSAPIKQWQAAAAVGQDAQTLAGLVGDAFKTILDQRPDLADAEFDFVSDQGKLKVVSGDLDEDDRQWLEQQLNANSALLGAVQQFNADVATAYDGTDQVAQTGNILHATGFQYADVGDQIDGAVSFLAMFQQLAHQAGQQGWLDDATYTDDQGGAIDLSETSATSLAGMIDLQRQVGAVQNGSVVATLGNGRVVQGAEQNPNVYFSAGSAAASRLSGALVPSAGASGAVAKGQIVDLLA